MPGYYIYLISSLPMLIWGSKPLLTFEKFLKSCRELLSEKDVNILKKVSLSGEYAKQSIHSTLKKWQDYDIALRNELTKIRASRKHIDAHKYVRLDGYTESSISHAAINAYRIPRIFEAEYTLDLERWRFLDELSIGHYFDLDILIIYALKLQILERWEKINTADKAQALEEAIKSKK